MRIALISDTHGYHEKVKIPKVDYLIHCGDFTNVGKKEELLNFNLWCRELKKEGTVKGVILVPGNHDISLERETEKSLKYLSDVDHILIHRYIEVEGMRIWGTPYTPIFFNWSFMKNEDDLYWIFNQIPVNLDILISHGPPFGVRDWNGRNHAGSKAMSEVLEYKRPKWFFCGHIHESRGVQQIMHENGATTNAVNASNMDRNYRALPPIILDIYPSQKLCRDTEEGRQASLSRGIVTND